MKCRLLFSATGLGPLSVLIIIGAFAAPPADGAQSSYPEVFISTKPPLMTANSGYRPLIDSERGTIVSFRSTFGVDRELLIPDHGQLPLFKIEFMDDQRAFKTVASAQAKMVKVTKSTDSSGTTFSMEFKNIGQLPVYASVTVRYPASETLTYWSLEVNNGSSWWIGHIQFPGKEFGSQRPFIRMDSYLRNRTSLH